MTQATQLTAKRRRLLVGSDIVLSLMVLVVIALLAAMLISHGDEAVMGPAGATPPFAAVAEVAARSRPAAPPPRLTALEHGRLHMQPGYRCPQHRELFSDAPGSCPLCGAALRWHDGAAMEPLEKSAEMAPGQRRLRNIPLYGAGWVERLLVREVGAGVQQGDLLLELYAPGLVAGTERQESLVRLYAPVAGRLRAIHAEEGKYVASGTVVMQIEDDASLWFRSQLTAAEAARVKAGQAVELSLADGRVMGEVGEVESGRDGQGDATAWLRFDDTPRLRAVTQVNVRIHATAAERL